VDTPLYKLGLAIATAFIMPAVAYVVGLGWMTLTRLWEVERTWRMICVLLPIFVFGMMLAVRFDIIRGAWEQSPALASIIYVVVGIGTPCALIPIALRLWRTPDC